MVCSAWVGGTCAAAVCLSDMCWGQVVLLVVAQRMVSPAARLQIMTPCPPSRPPARLRAVCRLSLLRAWGCSSSSRRGSSGLDSKEGTQWVVEA